MNAIQGNTRLGSESVLAFHYIATNLDVLIATCHMGVRTAHVDLVVFNIGTLEGLDTLQGCTNPCPVRVCACA